MSSSRSDPLYALRVQHLARTRLQRQWLSGQQGDDLNQSILGFTEAIYLPLPWKIRRSGLNIVEIFYFLTLAILTKESRQPEDVECCITYLRCLRGWCHGIHIDKLFLTECLVLVLAVQANLGLGDVNQDIKEMAGLCDELLTSNLSANALAGTIMTFVGVVVAHPNGLFRGKIPFDEVIGCLRKAMIQLPDPHLVSIVLSQTLHNRALITSCEVDFKEGMDILDEIIRFRDPGDRPSQYSGLALNLVARFSIAQFNASGNPEHLEQAIYRLRTLLDQISLENPNRLVVIRSLSFFEGLRIEHSALAGYQHAMSMQDPLALSPTPDIQDSQLVAMPAHSLPLDYASYQIHTGQLEQAINTLEQGRALLWPEIRGLRGRIRLTDTNLADKFIAVNRELEPLTFSSSLIYNVDGGDRGFERMHSFGHLLSSRYKRLLDERKEPISQIQAISGFDTLKTPSFDTLCSAANHGPVIIINHCKWISDIIIITRDSPPSLITMPYDFYARAKELQDQLLEERKIGLESDKYEAALRSVLKELYDLVGRPVINRLNELNVPEQSRVWWYPTSVFCSLPLHAMGPIPSDVGPPRYFLDLYIPSYTASLSALIESRKPSSQSNNKPSILLVAQPDEKMPQALKEMKVVQATSTKVTTLFSAKATPTAVVERLRDHPFTHIVCHGILEPGEPFEASFKLHGGKRLTLLDIVRSQLPDADFAFLSACHTSELTEESIADEVLHLAAVMQLCGYRSVVGTMWTMVDTDGRHLVRDFYQSVFSDEKQGVYCYERTAAALRDAVIKLRRRRGITLERWVNFVHYGA